jgi:hypothetical protein
MMDYILRVHLAMAAVLLLLRRPSWVPARMEAFAMAIITLVQLCLQVPLGGTCPWTKPVWTAVMEMAAHLNGCDLSDAVCDELAHGKFRAWLLAAVAAWVVGKWLVGPPRPRTNRSTDNTACSTPSADPAVTAPPPTATVPIFAVTDDARDARDAHNVTTNGRFNNCHVDNAIWAHTVTIAGAGGGSDVHVQGLRQLGKDFRE